MCVFISYIGTAELICLFFLDQFSVDLYVKDWVVTYKSLKTKEKSSWVFSVVVTAIYGSGHLQELFHYKI